MTFAELRQINVSRKAPPYSLSWSVEEWAAYLAGQSNQVERFFHDNRGQLAVGNFHEILPVLASIIVISDCIAARFGVDLDKAITEEV